MMYRLVFLVLCTLQCCASFKYFQDEIPNGGSVPHPCKQGKLWAGVGHFLDVGGGTRNPFGQDFERHGNTWTPDLCKLDSDGDGMTNGQELGDPGCVWKKGDTPNRQTEISHPGVCDVWSSPECFLKEVTHPRYNNQEDWLKEACTPDKFDCPSIQEDGMITKELKLDNEPVPAKETTYICKMFEFPTGDYHMAATEPIINNSYVLHHMVLFGCNENQELIDGAFECGMIPTRHCQTFLSIWSLGIPGTCYNNQSGVTIGTMGLKKIVLQYHWFNPQRIPNYFDSSGMTVYYTPNKRQHEVAVMVTGSDYFYLIPRQERVSVSSHCTQDCTRNGMSTEPIYVSSAWNHMHYLGIQMSIEIRRNNSHLLYLTEDVKYSYDSPQLFSYDPPFKLLPGDEIITTCQFNTMNRNKTVFFGDSTLDEMCLGFVTYFPRNNFPTNFGYCVSSLGVLTCDPATYEGCPTMHQHWNETYLETRPFYKDVMENCQSYSPCRPECVDAIVKHRKTERCLQGNNFEALKARQFQWSNGGREFLNKMSSCEVQVDKVLNPPPPGTGNNGNGSPTLHRTATNMVFLSLLMVFTASVHFG